MEKPDPKAVRIMFNRIAPRYDLMNRLLTLGQDRVWRRVLLEAAGLPEEGRLLDIGCGTGDIALMAARMRPAMEVFAADFTYSMLMQAAKRPGSSRICWVEADALALPFEDASFSVVVSGYLLRNTADLAKALTEQVRVLKPGGRLAFLETCPPANRLFAPAINLAFRYGIPALGSLVSGDRDAYSYLPRTTQHFLMPHLLSGMLKAAGLTGIRWQSFFFGTQTVMAGVKAGRPD
jgi:demethylmenaquinone methyltransferase/2-methoxy-6-polyprenyl-1,4-benzoquinol methylase